MEEKTIPMDAVFSSAEKVAIVSLSPAIFLSFESHTPFSLIAIDNGVVWYV